MTHTPAISTHTDDWRGLYAENWKGEIVPEAMTHPAKYSRALIRHIYGHLLAAGLVSSGDTIIDPFGGVALGALDAMRHGLRWVGCELEERFATLGRQNIDLWNARYADHLAGWGSAALLHGDSRNLTAVLQAGYAAAVSSPPYQQAVHGRNGIDRTRLTGNTAGETSQAFAAGYGKAFGQLGNLPSGNFAAAVSSPPYAETRIDGYGDEGASGLRMPDGSFLRGHEGWELRKARGQRYGESAGNLGNDRGETFWSAAADIVQQVHLILRPGGVAVWVVKDYVRNGAIVPFAEQWRQLCESRGFETLHVHRAWLVEHRGGQLTLDGQVHTRQVERKSFFRRLAERNGSPRIDWETVICQRKPARSGQEQ